MCCGLWCVLVLACVPVSAAVVNANFVSAATVPVTAAGYTAGGNTVDFTLGFAPPPGTMLTVVKNTALTPIGGRFDNLAQWQAVTLSYNGVDYPFVANYHGGSGNDLVLQWANTRAFAWGSNMQATLGVGWSGASIYQVPVPVDRGGVLGNRSVAALAAGNNHSIALCTDGSMAAWGRCDSGQLGNSGVVAGGSYSHTPVAVQQSGVLAGKTVVAVAAGGSHSLALCADGTLASWGANGSGQLGNNQTTLAWEPVLVDRSGVLAGRTVVAVAAGGNFSLAVCADGSLAAWGDNASGQLGNNGTANSPVPVLVEQGGALAGKQVAAVSARDAHVLALCTDGRLVAWGLNGNGQLGNNSTTDSRVPVAVNSYGLSGKTVTACAAGAAHSVALCSDGTLVTWGNNGAGQLGNGTTSYSNVLLPTAVAKSGALAGKTIVALAAGNDHTLAHCSDGTLAAWGSNAYKQTGDSDSIYVPTPLAVGTSTLAGGERFVAAGSRGAYGCSLALVASPPPAAATTLEAAAVRDDAATLRASVRPNGSVQSVYFEYGTTSAYGRSVIAGPATVSGGGSQAASLEITGLAAGTVYHFRVVVVGNGGTVRGGDRTFTTSDLAALSELAVDGAVLEPSFSRLRQSYSALVSPAVEAITLDPLAADPGATVSINGTPVTTGAGAVPVTLATGNNTIRVSVAAAGGSVTKDYLLVVTRLPGVLAFPTSQAVPATVEALAASGELPALRLDHTPVAGAGLMVVRTTGGEPIRGTFSNLVHGQVVELSRGGIAYVYVANYFGGSGNDLVLEWANTRLTGWGYNGPGALGRGITGNAMEPVAAFVSGPGLGSSVSIAASGADHGLVLYRDSSLAAAGGSAYGGQLGNGGWAPSTIPVAVDRTGVLAGKTFVTVAAGKEHNIVLCSDGTLAAWGNNIDGQLGNGTDNTALSPVLVRRDGVLAGKTIVALAAGGKHNLVLCSDGTLAAWGANDSGQLGNGSRKTAVAPVEVIRSEALLGKTVTAVAAGGAYSVALCSDGTLVAWGNNTSRQLGTVTPLDSPVPVAVNRSGALSGKTVVAVAAGGSHTLALCSDGSLAAWGSNYLGQLGDGTTTNRAVPVAVIRSGVLANKTVVAVACGALHNQALCADGTLVSWGSAGLGQLGNGTNSANALSPVAVVTTGLKSGERFAKVHAGSGSSTVFATVASPPLAQCATLAVTSVKDDAAVLNGSVTPNGTVVSVSFEYGPTTAYGSVVQATPATVGGTAVTPVSAVVTGLAPGATFHCRMVVEGPGGIAWGNDVAFTTTDLATLAGLAVSEGTMVPGFLASNGRYLVTVPHSVTSVTFTPLTRHAAASVTVNGTAVVPGMASAPVSLGAGNNAITVRVDAGDGLNTRVYQVTATRLPEVFAFPSPGSVPLTVAEFTGTGNTANLVLEHSGLVGQALTVVNNTGTQPIQGTFSNLAQGQTVALEFGGVTYGYVANYYGGTGNDLVLEWATTRLLAWGVNSSGQFGTGNTSGADVPVPAFVSGPTLGKPLAAAAMASGHGLVACRDGTLAAAGSNWAGELGDGTTINRTSPVAVSTGGVLSGRGIRSIHAGYAFSIALAGDGTLAAWGYNTAGQLGDGTTVDRKTPVLVHQGGVLAGKTIHAVATGRSHVLVLCTDGTLAAWGANGNGQLGNASFVSSNVPVLVSKTGALANKTPAAIAAGSEHSLVLCTDGTLAAWGYNWSGQLGNNSSSDSSVAVAVTVTDALAGKTVVELAAGEKHSLVRCSDGTMAAWGGGVDGQLGNGSNNPASRVPVAVSRVGALATKSVSAITAGAAHSLVLCSDNTVIAWGNWASGVGGAGYPSGSNLPVVVPVAALKPGERILRIGSGPAAYCNFALVASPPAPGAVTLAAGSITTTTATLRATVNPAGASADVFFEYGLTAAYGNTVAASPPQVVSGEGVNVSAVLGGLVSGETYHFRVVATTPFGTARGADQVFTTNVAPLFAGYTLATAWQTPALVSSRKLLGKASDPDGDALVVSAAGPASARGGTAVLGAAGILYTPPAGFSGSDTFPVTVSDGRGGNVSGTVTVEVGPRPDGGGAGSMETNPPQVTDLGGGKLGLKFQGIPGRVYQIQRSTDMEAWVVIASVTAGPTGAIAFTDESPPQPSAYYRLAIP